MGENLEYRGRVVPQWRENTVTSFQAASLAGVCFVEFDVQVTADGVPVIWHDDTVLFGNSTGTYSNKTVADLRFDDFQQLGRSNSSQIYRQFRSAETRAPLEGLEAWTCDKDDELPTLQQVFTGVPESIGFDVEIKMTTPDTVAATPPEEITRMLDAILPVVENCTAGSSRALMFSSFDPDVCAEVARRQSRFPVYFLTTGGHYPHADARRASLAAAVEFALSHGLQGVVMDAWALRHDDHVRRAVAAGLKVMTYGLDNNDPAALARQRELGVLAAIVDDVQSVLPEWPRL